MRRGPMLKMLVVVTVFLAFDSSGNTQKAKKPFRDDFKTSRDGLTKGWLEEYPWPDQHDASQNWRTIPGRLVLSRRGYVVRSLRATSFWHWDFWADGQEVVYEAGPIHGATSCVRRAIRSGKTLETWPGDCRNVPDDAPAWVKAATGGL